ncbi:hypothetical protein BGZ82_003736 [Podila clonocystis]|nr:hypothetical protein BGZ82_003736 [Podila clonocystis]
MAMAEAMKLFSGKGGASSGSDKSTVVQSAIAMAMKLFAGKSGGGGEGGAGGNPLMGLLGKAAENPQLAGMLGKAAENPQVADMLKKFM